MTIFVACRRTILWRRLSLSILLMLLVVCSIVLRLNSAYSDSNTVVDSYMRRDISSIDIHREGKDYVDIDVDVIDDDDVVNVVVCSDENTIGGMVTLINSIILNTDSHVRFHLILDDDSLYHAKEWLSKYFPNLDAEFVVFDTSLVEGKIRVRGQRQELASPLNYARFYIPTIFPQLNGRVVFLDDDTIVQGDIKELRDTYIATGDIAALSPDCNSTSNLYHHFINFDHPAIQNLGMEKEACSFNAGVFVADMKVWKQLNVSEQLDYYLQLNTKELVYGSGGSQPPMMIVFYNKFTPLPDVWHTRHFGWFISTYYKKEKVRRAKLLHWNGKWKPWGPIGKWISVWDKYFLVDPWGTWTRDRRKVEQPTVHIVRRVITVDQNGKFVGEKNQIVGGKDDGKIINLPKGESLKRSNDDKDNNKRQLELLRKARS